MIGYIVILAQLMLMTAQTTTSTTPHLSSPRSAAKSLRIAVERGSIDDAIECIVIADEDHRSLASAHVKLIVATKKLADAIAERFGSATDPLAAGALLAGDFQEVESAKITMRGDTSATMQLRGSERPLTLRRGSDGAWRADVLAFANLDATDDIHRPQQIALLDELVESIHELTADTRRGRFNTLGDVKAALQDRVHGATARSLRRDLPATRPASQPATSPS